MRRCDITGKTPMSGNNVSFSQRRTKRRWLPNLQNKTIVVVGKDGKEEKVRLKVSAQGIRMLKKKGLLTPTGASVKAEDLAKIK